MSRLLALCLFACTGILCGVPVLERPVVAQPLPDRAALRGVIVDQDGKPLSNAYLSLRRQNSDGAFAFWGSETSTDANGKFSFPNAEEGEYYLNVELGGFASSLNRTIKWDKRSSPLQIQLTRLVNAQLRFLANDGTPLDQQPVWIRMQSALGETAVYRLRTDPKGMTLVPNVVSSTYSLWAHNGAGYATDKVDLTYKTAAQPIDIRLQRGGNLHVVAKDSQGQALGGAAFAISPVSADEATRLGSLTGDLNEDYALLASDGDRTGVVSRDGDGTLDILNLPPGRYSARLAIPGFTNFAPRVIEVHIGQNTPLEWSFAPRRASSLTLDLRTMDDKPVANRDVTVRVLPINVNGSLARESVDENGFAMPFFPSGTGARRAISDATGRLRLYPLRPGRYRVFVAPRATDSSGDPAKESSPQDLDVGESGATATVLLPQS